MYSSVILKRFLIVNWWGVGKGLRAGVPYYIERILTTIGIAQIYSNVCSLELFPYTYKYFSFYDYPFTGRAYSYYLVPTCEWRYVCIIWFLLIFRHLFFWKKKIPYGPHNNIKLFILFYFYRDRFLQNLSITIFKYNNSKIIKYIHTKPKFHNSLW